jgi:hypothetical protein
VAICLLHGLFSVWVLIGVLVSNVSSGAGVLPALEGELHTAVVLLLLDDGLHVCTVGIFS